MFGRKKEKARGHSNCFTQAYPQGKLQEAPDIDKKFLHDNLNFSAIQQGVFGTFANEKSLITILIDAPTERVESGASSCIGSRCDQQDTAMLGNDYAYIDTNQTVAILCDGMGGLQGGQLASNLCAGTLYGDFHTMDAFQDVPGFLKASVHKLDRIISQLTGPDQKPIHAGTTLAAIVIVDDRLYWVSVGDSRIYLIRRDEIVQATVDHNYQMLLNQKVKRGVLTKEQADTHPKREALVSYIGMGGVKYIDMNLKPFQMQDGDIILICSDGVYRSLEESEIKEIVKHTKENMTGVANALIQRTIGKKRINQDNATAILVKYMNPG